MALRIAIGRLPIGAEVEIEQQMQDRLPLVGDEMVAGYVGRRLVGPIMKSRSSACGSAFPARQPLDEPIWPDLAARKVGFFARSYFAAREPGAVSPRPA